MVLRMVVVAVVLVAGLAMFGCGDGGASRVVVARVGGGVVTQGEVDHWMKTEVAATFYEVTSGHAVPEGLVSEPADIARCVARLRALSVSVGGLPRPSAGALFGKCRALYQQMRLQAVGFLVNTRWTIAAFADLGITASDAEVKRLFESIKAARFPNPTDTYLTGRRRSVADELLLLKLDVVSSKAGRRLTAGGKTAIAQFTEVEQAWTAKTSCRAGYVVKNCKQYTGAPPPAGPSAAVLLEQMAVIIGARPCIDHATCE
jgi:hypothetical protein